MKDFGYPRGHLSYATYGTLVLQNNLPASCAKGCQALLGSSLSILVMSSTSTPLPSQEAPEWRHEPHHITLRETVDYTIFVGHLPPHDRCSLHAHYNPTVCLSLISIIDVTDHVVSDPIRRKQTPSPISIAKGTLLSYNSTPSNPHVHKYTSDAHPSLFLCIESPLGRAIGPPSPLMSIDVLPHVSVRHHGEDLPFASAAVATLPPGCTVRIHVNTLDGEKVLCRLMTTLMGPALDLLDVRSSPDHVIEHLRYDKYDPPKLAFAITNFRGKGFDSNESTTITNNTAHSCEVFIIDFFTKENSTTSQ